jgi:hypothetical protein
MHDHSDSSAASSPSLSELWETRSQRRNEHHLTDGIFPAGELPNSDPEKPDLVPIVAVESDPDCRAPASRRAPGSRNTGAKIPSQCAQRGAHTRKRTHAPGTEPDLQADDYFGELRIDTVKLSARVETDSVDRLGFRWVEKKQAAADAGKPPVIKAHDGTELKVKPHTPDDNRAVIAEADGIVLTAVPKCDVPFLSIKFRADRCWASDPAELAEWAAKFAAHHGIRITDTLVSRLDLCTDIDSRFRRNDVDRFEGQHRGNLTGTMSFSDGRKGFTGLRYDRTASRDLTFRVYDKRAEADARDGSFWPEVWDQYGINADTPIWRVEYEAQRGRLKERGIDSWKSLNSKDLERFWSYCTEDFARMDKRQWSDVQEASTEAAAERAEVESIFDPDGLHAQADGCIGSAAEGTGNSKAEELARLIQDQDEDTQREVRQILSEQGDD